MLINPINVRMSRHHLEALHTAAGKRLGQLHGDSSQRRILEDAHDILGDILNAAKAELTAEARP